MSMLDLWLAIPWILLVACMADCLIALGIVVWLIRRTGRRAQ